MTLPAHLVRVLPPETRHAWERVAPLLPGSAYLVGGTAIATHLGHRVSRDLDFFLEQPEDLHALAGHLAGAGRFAVTTLSEGTLNCVLDEAKLQFLLADSQHGVEPTMELAGLRVAGLGDLLAMKLAVLPKRGELRDYFDLMVIEQRAGRRVEEGLGLFRQRYRPVDPENAVSSILRALGHFDDVADDPQLPVSRGEIQRYFIRRQKEVVIQLDHRAASIE